MYKILYSYIVLDSRAISIANLLSADLAVFVHLLISSRTLNSDAAIIVA